MNAVQKPGSQVRADAARVLSQVLTRRRYLDVALEEQRRTGEVPFEGALLQELCYGTLRWYHQLAGVAALFLTRPLKAKDSDVHALLLLGLYQLRHTRVAPHAAVDATVEAVGALGKPWAKSLVNACLRAYSRETPRVEEAIATSEELRYSHPRWLIERIRADYPNDWVRILEANNQRPPMTLRVNTARVSREEYTALLRAQHMEAREHPLAGAALVLDEPVSVERLPAFAKGYVSVQDAGAQLAAPWLDAGPTDRVLDACAAPGGKAAHILERNGGVGELTALDVDPVRLQKVAASLQRLGLRARLHEADAAEPAQWWDGRAFTRILVDAPCSATGVIRRHPDIKVRRRPEDLVALTASQRRILDGVWPSLAPGGKLLYVTCSLLRAENQQQIASFIARQDDAEAVPVVSGANPGGHQILPGEEQMDGFFYACLRKR